MIRLTIGLSFNGGFSPLFVVEGRRWYALHPVHPGHEPIYR